MSVNKAILAFLATVVLAIVGMLIDQNIGLDGNLSIVVAIAAMGSIILYQMGKNSYA